MRPKYLTLSAFGPYAGKIEIDFDKLGANGLYIITGATGAGKTTIFDAISYALFGEASSGNREPKMLRSMYAEPDIPTFVELIFTLDGRDYMVKRNPPYQRKAKRGTGTTEEKASVELTLPSGNVLTKEADEKLRELLCINHEQFKKIVMIAQGEFRDVLQADTKERQRIFRHIFGTEIYNDFARILAEEKSNASDNCTAIDYRINGNLEGLSCEKDSGYEERVEAARRCSISYEETGELIDILIALDEAKYAEAEKLINDETETLNQLTAKKEQSKAIVEKSEKLGKVKKASEEQKAQKTELAEKLKEAESKTEIAEKCRQDAAIIENDLPQYDSLTEKTEQAKALKLRLKDEQNELDACKETITALQGSLLKKRTEQADLSDAGEKLAELKGLKDKAEEKLVALSSLRKAADKVSTAKTEYEKASLICLKASDTYNKAADEAKELRKLFNCEQAGIMAEGLTEGSPCPVCGSTHHPNKAVKSVQAPTEAETEAAEKKATEALQTFNKASTESGKAKTALEMTQAGFSEEFTKIFGTQVTENYLSGIELEESNLKANKKKILADIRTENDRAERKNALRDEIPADEKKLSELTERQTELSNAVTQTKTQLTETEKSRDEIASKLNFSDKKKAEAEILRLNKEAEKIESARKNARTQFDSCNEYYNKLQGEIESLSKELEGKEIPDLTEIDNTVKEHNTKKKAEEVIKEAAAGRLSANRKVREQFISAIKELAVAEAELNMINDLCVTANGQISGKQKIQLETFIQARYFEKILLRANRYLKQMSSDQYAFERKKDGNNQSQSGLDLNVIDYYNGSRRNVSSLSGGEAFFASLSLALGLSEEVRESAGGIHLDCMFVDEGFGSLDGDTLTQSMNALSSISTDGMLIGIISHVEALEKAIDNKIVVSKTQEHGSTASVIV